MSDRSLYFGAPSVYAVFAATSDDELIRTAWGSGKRTRMLSSMIAFGKEPAKQRIFYRWVRRAYQKKYGDDVDVPELIRRGMSKELADMIAAVRGSVRVKSLHKDFHAGGFNPRPIKFNHHYLLGTLSEHATGMAVDIDDGENPQLTLEQWLFVEEIAELHVKRSGRWTTEADAEVSGMTSRASAMRSSSMRRKR